MTHDTTTDLIVIGGGLAGCEAAWQAAQRGIRVALYEMRPGISTGAHTGSNLAELVCSNSLGSDLPDRASGVLKNELRRMGSLLLGIAGETSLPAGGALAVDRSRFAQAVTEAICTHPNITVVRQEVEKISDQPTIIASGPLTSPALSMAIREITGNEHLYFYDAVAPIISGESINMEIAFRASRYEVGIQQTGDYINCPLSRAEYEDFVQALLQSEKVELRDFEANLEKGVRAGADRYFEGCLPVEILAKRGLDALAYGPMRPIGLIDPRTGKPPHAIVQLRQDNLAATLYNLVGFQTNLKYTEQRRVFHMIPGLGSAEFVRYGQMHRNTFIFSPAYLRPTLQYTSRDDLFFAGQITGVEGYVGNIGTGLLAGWNASRVLQGMEAITLPQTTMLGSLCEYITQAAPEDYQPMKANFGILPGMDFPEKKPGRRQKARYYAQRSRTDLEEFLCAIDDNPV